MGPSNACNKTGWVIDSAILVFEHLHLKFFHISVGEYLSNNLFPTFIAPIYPIVSFCGI